MARKFKSQNSNGRCGLGVLHYEPGGALGSRRLCPAARCPRWSPLPPRRVPPKTEQCPGTVIPVGPCVGAGCTLAASRPLPLLGAHGRPLSLSLSALAPCGRSHPALVHRSGWLLPRRPLPSGTCCRRQKGPGQSGAERWVGRARTGGAAVGERGRREAEYKETAGSGAQIRAQGRARDWHMSWQG